MAFEGQWLELTVLATRPFGEVNSGGGVWLLLVDDQQRPKMTIGQDDRNASGENVIIKCGMAIYIIIINRFVTWADGISIL